MITRIDMHLRDERLLDWLKDRNNQRIPADKMADAMSCHPNTIHAMVKRLEGANLIKVERSRRGGHLYKVIGLSCPQN